MHFSLPVVDPDTEEKQTAQDLVQRDTGTQHEDATDPESCHFLVRTSKDTIVVDERSFKSVQRCDQVSWLLHTPQNKGSVIVYDLTVACGQGISVYKGRTEQPDLKVDMIQALCVGGQRTFPIVSPDVLIVYDGVLNAMIAGGRVPGFMFNFTRISKSC